MKKTGKNEAKVELKECANGDYRILINGKFAGRVNGGREAAEHYAKMLPACKSM